MNDVNHCVTKALVLNKDKKNRNKKLHIFKCRNCNYTSNDNSIGAMNLYNKRSEITVKLVWV